MNVGTNDAALLHSGAAAWEAIYVGVLRKLRKQHESNLKAEKETSWQGDVLTIIEQLKKGANEATKTLNRGITEFIVMCADL